MSFLNQRCYFLFVPLRPFFYAALTKRWKVQFRKGLRKFNNVDSKRHIIIRTAILYIYICIYYVYSHSSGKKVIYF